MREGLRLLVVLTFLSSQLLASNSAQHISWDQAERSSSPLPVKVDIYQTYDYRLDDFGAQSVEWAQSPLIGNPDSLGRLSEYSNDSSQDVMMLSLLCAESEKTEAEQPQIDATIIKQLEEALITLAKLYNELPESIAAVAIMALLSRSPFFRLSCNDSAQSSFPTQWPTFFQLPGDVQDLLYSLYAKASKGTEKSQYLKEAKDDMYINPLSQCI